MRMKPIISVVGVLGLLVLIGFGFHRSHYPFGERPCCLPCTLECLREYAAVHKGCFPDGHSPQNALSKLYFENFISADLLAGISGDIKLAERELSAKSDISDEASSWVYWPGFRDTDDPKIAIIWEGELVFVSTAKEFQGDTRLDLSMAIIALYQTAIGTNLQKNKRACAKLQ